MAARVLIAGAGVAALEATLALRALAEERVEVDLVGTEPHFWYRPLSVAEPFELGEVRRHELAALAAAAGAQFTLGTLLGVDASSRAARTSVGDIPYDFLLVAVGATRSLAVPGALTFRGPAESEKVEALLGEIDAGDVRRVAFVVPVGAVWSLPLYELALMTAAHLTAHRIRGVELVFVTPESAPLDVFGHKVSADVRDLLDERRIAFHTSGSPAEYRDGVLRLGPEGELEVDRVVALPRLCGGRLHGLPQTSDGFVPIDPQARVQGLDEVYAAGDIVDFPVKQGSIATQLADVAATSIASRAGADVRPDPFRPVLRGVLLTGDRPRYLRRELSGKGESVTVVGREALWWPPAKITGRYLTPFLASYSGLKTPT